MTNKTGGFSVPQIIMAFGMLLVAGSIIAAVFFSNTGGQVQTSAPAPARVGDRIADFTLEDLSGKEVSLSDFTGQPVLINFWATWCPPCRREMPGLNDFYHLNRSNGFVILAVNVGETREQAGSFAAEMKLDFPVLLDGDYYLADQLMVDDYPTSILVGRDGTVQKVHIGYFSPEDLQRELGLWLK